MENNPLPTTPPSPEPIVPVTPAKIHKKGLLVILGILILLLVLGLSYLAYSSKSSPTSTSPSPTPISQTAPNTASSSATLSNNPLVPTPLTVKMDVQSSDSAKIQGNLTLTNTSKDKDFSNVYYYLVLSTPDISQTKTVNGKVQTTTTDGDPISFTSSDNFNLNPGETKTVPFTFKYPPTINSGSYKFQAIFNSLSQDAFGATFKNLDLAGSNEFLTSTNCSLLVSNKSYQPNIGPNVGPGVAPEAQCSFLNPSSKNETLKANIEYATRFVMNNPPSPILTSTPSNTFTLAPHETKTLTIPLPALQTPQVYQALVILVNQDNQQVSKELPFRWIIQGPSATISQVLFDKNYYQTGDQAKVQVLTGLPLDHFWGQTAGTKLDNAKLVINLTDSNGQSCGQTEKTLEKDADFGQTNLTLSVSKNCSDPKMTAQILNNTTILATLSSQKQTPVSPTNQTPKSSPPSNQAAIIFIVIILVLIVADLILLSRKPKAILPILVTVILFSLSTTNILAFSVSGSSSASAVTSYNGTETADGSFTGSVDPNGNGSISVSVSGPINTNYCTNGNSDQGIGMDFLTYVDGALQSDNSFSGSKTAFNQYPVNGSYTVNNLPTCGDHTVTVNAATYLDYDTGCDGDHNGCTGSARAYGPYNGGSGTVSFTPCGPGPFSLNSPSNSCPVAGHPASNLSWSPSSNATSYQLYRNGASDGGSTSSTSENDPGVLVPNTPYSYYVIARDGSGNTLQSNTVSTTTPWCDTVAPVISVSVPPPAGQTCVTPADLGASSSVTTTATDNVSGIKSVTFNIYSASAPNGSPIISVPGTLSSCSSPSSAPGGGCLNGVWTNSTAFCTVSSCALTTGQSYVTKAVAVDAAGNPPQTSAASSAYNYDSTACIGPFLRTGQGDVGTQGSIKTPGGP